MTTNVNWTMKVMKKFKEICLKQESLFVLITKVYNIPSFCVS